jgi:TP901 family phage tail tape measure protein
LLNSLGLGIVLSARDMASSTLGRVERAYISLDQRVDAVTDDIDRSMRGFGGKALAMAGGIAGAFGAAKIIGTASSFEEGLTKVGSLADATTEQMQQLEKAALSVGGGFSPVEATNALREFASAGYKVQASIDLLGPSLDFAAASFGELTPESAAGLATQAMKAFGIAVSDARLTVDQLAKAAGLFSMRNDDLPLALGIVTRGAQAMGQSMTESLIAFGLVKELIPGTERAATAASVAMERFANPATQKMISNQGVAIFDTTGKFRDLLDVVVDLMPKLSAMTEKDRSRFLLKAFGAEGLAGVQNIMTQLTNGVESQTGELLKGADAVAYLRSQFANAAGTVETIKQKMLNIFSGQGKLLAGGLLTLAIALGQPFLEVLTPILKVAVRLVAGLTDAITNTPGPVKRFIAGVVVAGAAVAGLVVGIAALRAGFALFTLGLHLAKAAIASAAASLWPIVLVVGAVAAVIAGFVVAYRKNLGGFADFVQGVYAKVRLAFDGIVQVFRDGAFSGAVMDELGKVENSGIKRFVITLYMVWHRLQRLWAGVTSGFSMVIDEMRPVWRELVGAFRDVGDEAGKLLGGVTGAANALPSAQFRSFGQSVGRVFGWIASAIAAVLGWYARLYAGVLSGFNLVKKYVGGAFAALGDAFGTLLRLFNELIGAQGDTTIAAAEVGSVLRVVGQAIGVVLGGAITAVTYLLTGLIWLLNGLVIAAGWVKDRFMAATEWIVKKSAVLAEFFDKNFNDKISIALGMLRAHFAGIRDFVLALVKDIKEAVQGMIDWILEAYRTVSGVLGSIRDTASGALDTAGGFLGDTVGAVGGVLGIGSSASPSERAGLAPSASAAVAEAGTRSGMLAELVGQVAAAASAARSEVPPAPIHVALQVDGETLARVSARATVDAARRAFVPVF